MYSSVVIIKADPKYHPAEFDIINRIWLKIVKEMFYSTDYDCNYFVLDKIGYHSHI